MSDLKPCPFCGGQAEILTDSHVIAVKTSVGCQDDECRGFIGLSWLYNTEAEAIAAWNKRTDDYERAAEYWQRMYEQTFTKRTCNLIDDEGLLHCSNCGGAAKKQLWAYWNYCPKCGARVVE